jgi:predicted dehydrogenase
MPGTGEKLGIGIIGCGRAAETLHLPALARLDSAQVVALADSNEGRLQEVSDRYGIKERYADYRSMLEKSSADIVAVCTPTHLHAEMGAAVLDSGKHLFLEKPVATSLDECDRLVEKAADSASRVTVGFNLRHHRLVREAKELLGRGLLGAIEGARTQWTSPFRFQRNFPEWRGKRELAGGVLFEIAVHHFDLWRVLLNSEVDEIQVCSRLEEGIDETAALTARLGSGVVVSSLFSQATAPSNEIDIFGRMGRLRLSLYRFDGLELSGVDAEAGGIVPRLRGILDTIRDLPAGISIMRQGGDYRMSYRYEWEHFLNAIRNGSPVSATLEDGRRSIQSVLAAVESASRGSAVKVS